MNDQIKQIAERLRGLRDVLNLTTADIAEKAAVSVAQVENYESGVADIPMSFICAVAQAYGIEPTAILSGEEPKMEAFYLTRNGKGASVERTKAYKYQSLAAGFKNAKAEPFEVTVEPNDNSVVLNSHMGQEFNFILEGKMLLKIAGNELVLQEGDSIYFDATKPHGMKALDNKRMRFLAIIL
jgi:transcriptional regulator with XRE-family HTH domain